MADLLWSDPSETTIGFIASNRGQGHLFGADALEQFCQRMEIDVMCRAHQVHSVGYRMFGNERLITIFSAPNYGGFQNDAACVVVDDRLNYTINIVRPYGRKNGAPPGTEINEPVTVKMK